MSHSSTCTCTGCAGLSGQTPVSVINRPGLTAIAYRVGTQPTFTRSMLARLATTPAGRGLTTRHTDDFSIGLLDAWATLADVLTFYQERIANESYLRIATERLSVQELARLIGYELQPGVAASTWLAFTLDAATTLQLVPDATRSGQADLPPVMIPARTGIQSIPGPGELPQTFETTEAIQGRAEWNAMKPRLTRDQELAVDMADLWLQGTSYNLKPGDVILIDTGTAAGQRKLRRIGQVRVDETAKTTRLTLVPELHREVVKFELAPVRVAFTKPSGSVNTFFGESKLTGAVVAGLQKDTWSEANVAAMVLANNWSRNQLIAISSLAPQKAIKSSAFVFRRRAFLFGYNAPKQITRSITKVTDKDNKTTVTDTTTAVDWHTEEMAGQLFLDMAYDEMLPGGVIAVQQATEKLESVTRFIDVLDVTIEPRTAYGLSAKTTELTVATADDGPHLVGTGDITPLRTLTIHAQSELLTVADIPDETPVSGTTLTLDRFYPGLEKGRKLMLIGTPKDLPGILTSELLTIAEAHTTQGIQFTEVTLEAPGITDTYIRNTVTINGNVAPATHGETIRESLGSGDASQVFQRFVLKQSPLTYVAADTPTGATTTLEVRVNDVRWHEVESLLDAGPQDRVFITRLDDVGRTTVIFGDGKTGARLPTGPENVKAVYRKGIGLGGLVKANQLSQLSSRPAGVKAASNPLDAAGAADRESLAEARHNAPLPVLTLGRVVSLQDYADFARAFAGVEKALATWTWLGQRRGLFLTIGGVNGAAIEPTSPLYQKLVSALRAAGDPNVAFRAGSYRQRFFQLTAGVRIDPDFLPDKVLATVEAALYRRFSFAARDFGQPVALSEVVAAMQDVRGVVAVDVTACFRIDNPPGLPTLLEASVPQPGADDNTIVPAELLTLAPGSVTLTPL